MAPLIQVVGAYMDYLKRLNHLSLSTLNQWFRAFA